ncbi:MAG TPA: O-antigen ligase family protein [Patescibacteria group bacterium]|nr:O-antigen ligase family protein [Patescibacteria group bacterium]
MKIIAYCDKLIHWSFYLLFFLVPLFFTSNTSELFELNKMWLTWGLTVIIMGAWIIKMTAERKISIRRTPLDLPLVLFLFSQLISTIISLDSHTSFWGYYSRFNGGFLSLLTYTLLYFAFVSNVTLEKAKRYFLVTIFSGIIVALWGLPSHFGYDPTCFLFRGKLDTSCWTESFRPTIRIFSTLGQPAWMAAYLAVLLPFTMALTLWETEKQKKSSLLEAAKNYWVLGLVIVDVLFYVDLLFTDTRAGFVAFWVANILFWLTLWWLKILSRKKIISYFLIFNVIFLMASFFFSTPISQLKKFSLSSLMARPAIKTSVNKTAGTSQPPPKNLLDTGITDSGTIRLLVWRGAISAWEAHPLFGTGVETFAFAYYLYRPAAHNMTSEWDYLYNKAHNEYLNYLATTGIVGLGTHLMFLGGFFFFAIRELLRLSKANAEKKDTEAVFLAVCLPAAFTSIIVSNFFGFSVVMINLFLYLIPAWFFVFLKMLPADKEYVIMFGQPTRHRGTSLNLYQWTISLGIIALSFFFLVQLVRFWQADVAYALGMNLDRAGEYQSAYPSLIQAVQIRPSEPVFKDELSTNLATLVPALYQNNEATSAAQLAQQAISLSNDVTTNYPNNVVFWKSRVRVFYSLAQIDSRYYTQALDAILQAKKLAPTDAKISYNVSVLYGQNNQLENGIKELTRTIQLKPNYRDAFYARGLFYHQLAQNSSGTTKTDYENKAVADMMYLYDNFAHDTEAQKSLSSWGVTAQ